MNLVGYERFYKIKINAYGSFVCYKARLVAKGFHQEPMIDFYKTFRPVAKLKTIQTVLSIAISKSWLVHELDVKKCLSSCSFTRKCIHNTISWFKDPYRPHHVCKLHHFLYGLK